MLLERRARSVRAESQHDHVTHPSFVGLGWSATFKTSHQERPRWEYNSVHTMVCADSCASCSQVSPSYFLAFKPTMTLTIAAALALYTAISDPMMAQSLRVANVVGSVWPPCTIFSVIASTSGCVEFAWRGSPISGIPFDNLHDMIRINPDEPMTGPMSTQCWGQEDRSRRACLVGVKPWRPLAGK